MAKSESEKKANQEVKSEKKQDKVSKRKYRKLAVLLQKVAKRQKKIDNKQAALSDLFDKVCHLIDQNPPVPVE